MPVYADVLFVLNGFINYLLLLCNMKILKLNTSRLRLLLGAAIGSLFSLKIFLPQFEQITEFMIRLVFIAVIVWASYKIYSLKEFVKSSFGFLAVSFGFSGLMIGIIYFINPPDLIYDNGVYYYNISFLNVILLSCAGFCFISICEKLFQRKTNNHFIYQITVTFNQKSITGRGLADTGNTLKEPFSGSPVIVADYCAVKQMAPESVKQYIENAVGFSQSGESIRIIPVSTVSGTGLLPAFKANNVIVKGTKLTARKENVFIAVSKEKLCGGEFEFLLNNSILEVDENANHKKIHSKNKVKAI
ncbi:MAG: sigma-E processing peptidase SpoIIGA [Clostridia bacterium]|nr:sigma-E processing peptidase SpoIIGA [Clostridia bacterium]